VAVPSAPAAARARASGARRARGPPLPLAMRACPRVHFKAVIVDAAFLYLGSANWTGAGLGAKGEGRRNFELGVVTDDAELIDDVQKVYSDVWRGGGGAGGKAARGGPAPRRRRGAGGA